MTLEGLADVEREDSEYIPSGASGGGGTSPALA
jgi:hypothetical protein